MMALFRLLGGLVAAAFAALMALALYLHYADLNRHRETIESLVGESTGRDFRIGGDLQLALWPALEFSIGQVSLANAPWSEEPEMLRVKHLSARVSALSLLSGPIRVQQLRIEDVELLVETDAQGHSNWELGSADEETSTRSDSDGGIPVALEQAELTHIQVTLRQPAAEDRVIRLDDLLLQEGDRDLELTARGQVLAHSLDLAGTIGPLQELRERGAVVLQLEGTLGDLALTVQGQVDDLETGAGGRLEALLQAEDIATVLADVDSAVPLSGPLRIEATAKQLGEVLEVDSDASLGGVETRTRIVYRGHRIELEQQVNSLGAVGALLEIEGLPDLPLDLRAVVTPGNRSTELHEMLVTVGDTRVQIEGLLDTGGGASTLEVQGKGGRLAGLFASLPDIPFGARAGVEFSPGQLTLNPLQLTFGESDIGGRLSVAYGEQLALKADLKSRLIDLGALQPPTAAAASPAPAASPPPATGTPAGKRYLFGEEPLPLQQLQALQVDASWSIDRLLDGSIAIEKIILNGSAQGGKIKATMSAQGPYGGVARNRLQLEATDQAMELDAEIYAREVRFNLMSGDIDDPRQIPASNVTIKLQAAGASPRQMAAGANGSVLVTQGPGRVNNNMMGAVSGDIFAALFSALNPLAEQEPYSRWECSLAQVDIGNGLAQVKQLILQGEKIMIVGGGEIDLTTEDIRIEFNTKPRKGVGVSADMFIKPFVALRGTLASPAIGLNEKGTLLTAGAAAATGGLSILLKAAADRLGGSVDHCEKTLPGFPHPPMPG